MTRHCTYCGKPFEPRPQIPDQAHCSAPACQRAHKRQWQQAKLQSDPDYRINQRAAQQAWSQRNQDYWRNYRDARPAYTYNNRINRISSIQEHHMLRRAVERGVTPERLAKALNVDISLIHKKVSLLEGICPEAVEMLKDQHFAANLGSVLRKLKPTRQVECVELMLTANNMTVAYAEALLAATPPHLLVSEKRPRKISGVTAEQMVKMEREMGNIQGQLKLVEQSYGQDVLLLVLARGYLAKLLENKSVARYIRQRRPEVLEQFEVIVETTSLDQ